MREKSVSQLIEVTRFCYDRGTKVDVYCKNAMRLWYASFMRGREEAWFSLIAIFLASLFLAVSAFLVFASFAASALSPQGRGVEVKLVAYLSKLCSSRPLEGFTSSPLSVSL